MTTPGGWSTDSSGTGAQRYFDGLNWTEHQLTAPSPKRRVWPWILTGVIVQFLGLCGTVVVVGDHLEALHSLIHPDATITDGGLQFALTNFTNGALQDGPQPTGEYFLAHLTVTNSSQETQSFTVQNQKLIDAAGREYPAIGMVTELAWMDETKLVDIKPGATLKVILRFDGPKATKLTAIELHESESSTGARVSVRWPR